MVDFWTIRHYLLSFLKIKLPGYNPRIVKTVTTVKKIKQQIFIIRESFAFSYVM